MARNLKWWFAFVRPSAATIPSSSSDTAVLLWVMLYIRLSLLTLRLSFSILGSLTYVWDYNKCRIYKLGPTNRPTGSTWTRWDAHDGSTHQWCRTNSKSGKGIRRAIQNGGGNSPMWLFIFYLAKSLKPNRECIEHNYASVEQCGNILPEECKDRDYYIITRPYFKTETK